MRTLAKPNLTAPQATTAPVNKPAQIPTCTSNVLLFLTNSRLLDLDANPDWPDITPTTFSAKDAAGGQKKRIQCVEWALYQLFCLWDYNDAQNKLRPFYPPADQVQSINLRAALVRSLEAAKKNGVLGRDVVIRKTVLDECKGERLEEVLAVFSSVVLKKFVAERALNSGPEYRPTISEAISLENWGYSGDRTELNGLLLAHKASLKSTLAKKNAAREKYRGFKELLDMKERGIARRREQAKSSAREGLMKVSTTEKAEVRRVLRNNWTGNEQWVDGLLGLSSSHKGGLFNTPFEEVWGGVRAGNVTDLEEQTAGLLEQLEQRVHHQKIRLQKWEDFRKSTFGNIRPRVARDSAPKERKNENGFDFTAHLDLNLNEPTSSTYEKFDYQPPEYAKLLVGLRADLGVLKDTRIPDFSSLINTTRRGPANTISSQFIPQESAELAADPVSDLSDWDNEPEEVIPQPKVGEASTDGNARPTDIPRGFVGSKKQLPVSHEDRRTVPIDHEDPIEVQGEHRRSRTEPWSDPTKHKPSVIENNGPTSTSAYEESQAPRSPDQSRSRAKANGSQPPLSGTKSPTQALADEILNSINNTSPSPVKKTRYTLSLTERAQLSLARTTSFGPTGDETPQTSPVKERHMEEDDDLTTDNYPERGEEYEDLMTRTRRSMVGFEAARQKAQLERRRSLRKSKMAQRRESYFPKVDEEGMADFTVIEGLMEESQEDYEAIFRSRPRIATSPAPSPNRQWVEEK